ncbi:sugar phosphate isomerase/epimerase family protein [Actinoalloteichus hymeniacidonis]|uniref:Sugar phosphate isomerase/epimerase n=1 Tax=Actinoalloteichus hymeniacidonis TaxID=340345 RepID=A0AAC9HRY2_9PSEU|nr:sugar phosphate isomerase/epimerase family protein [Actinoalloteichus hymeniacidonis]AOS64285.1 sugar phosphate isomerase/epimerase [Actinoalloteichus hymeniacidonis]MBB5907647.1 D-psicose/D-tagatose/L-ribulose 3-epimerase [Actinoalloteichus hymeniacidonis]
MFPIGVNTWVWESPLSDATLAELIPRIAGWGFDAVEIPMEQADDIDAGRTAELLAAHGLAAVAVCAVTSAGRNLVAAPARQIRDTQDYLRGCVDLAARLGAGSVGGPLYAEVGRTWRMDAAERATVYRELRENLAPVADYAGERGVRLAVEPLNRYETSVLNTVEQALTALDGLPAETVGLMLDTYHLNIEERDLVTPVLAAGGRIAHVQVCANDRGAPGADHLDWPGFLAALTKTGYRGSICIESFTAHNDAIAVAASIWRPLAETQDALAVDGLAFLRRIQAG